MVGAVRVFAVGIAVAVVVPAVEAIRLRAPGAVTVGVGAVDVQVAVIVQAVGAQFDLADRCRIIVLFQSSRLILVVAGSPAGYFR
ncbi:MAG: hypothetical protein HY789_09900 [Deltaproteobacteria bacterium]|nr:hypothetical protein [Deltaproteobacteria bacterium]